MPNSKIWRTVAMAAIMIIVIGQATQSEGQAPPGGECVQWSSANPPVLGCNFVKKGHNIYTNPLYGVTVQTLTSALYAPIFAGNASLMTPTVVFSYDCLTEWLRLWCGTIFRECSQVGTNAIPHPPCRSVCVQTNMACAADFAGLGLPPLDCDQQDPNAGPGIPLWYPISVAPNTCTLMKSNEPVELECPSPLYWIGPDTDPLSGTMCSQRCHDSLRRFSPYFDDVAIYITVLWWTNIVLMVYMIVTYSTFPLTRAWPKRVVLFISIGFLFIAIAFCGNSAQPIDHLTCDGEYQFSTNAWSEFSAWSLKFGILVVTCWWCVQGIILFWVVALQKDIHFLEKWEWFMHL